MIRGEMIATEPQGSGRYSTFLPLFGCEMRKEMEDRSPNYHQASGYSVYNTVVSDLRLNKNLILALVKVLP
jgi:hypothetical protein